VAHAELDNHDTAWSSATRFAIEVIAWVAGPWAAADLAGSGWVAVPVLIALVAVPAIFSTPGDKNQVVVATPGPIRVAIELGLLGVALVASSLVWPGWVVAIVVLLGIAMVVTGRSRWRWLLVNNLTGIYS